MLNKIVFIGIRKCKNSTYCNGVYNGEKDDLILEKDNWYNVEIHTDLVYVNKERTWILTIPEFDHIFYTEKELRQEKIKNILSF